ncbi:hypothetical protein [Streptomyces sp. NPDC057838]|uniref:hypothetical protein n=1 Tax=unclassified Streptomyces TaxID=2593676 RepID=UPI0036BECB60
MRARARRAGEVLARVRSELLDTAGLGLLASAAYTWSTGAGLAASGVAALLLNWRFEQGSE